MTRLLAVGLLSIAVTACGGDDGPTSIAAVERCLEQEGLRTLGGAHTPDPDDTDAPDRGELITKGAFIAFYSTAKRADELADGVRENSGGINGRVERHGDVTVVYLPGADRDAVERCVG